MMHKELAHHSNITAKKGGTLRQKIPIILCLLGMLACLWGLLSEQLPYLEAEQLYQDMRQLFQTQATAQTIPENSKGAASHAKGSVWFSQEENKFPNMVAWLRCEETELDYPVMQGSDNSFYLSHLADGSRNKLGAIFLDFQADSSFSSPISVIYGHAAKNDQMFGVLNHYKDQAYYDAHPVLELYTPQADYKIELLAAFLVDGSSDTYPSCFSDLEEYNAYLENAAEHSFFYSSFELESSPQQLIILSTCAYDFENARLALLGRLRKVTDYTVTHESP